MSLSTFNTLTSTETLKSNMYKYTSAVLLCLILFARKYNFQSRIFDVLFPLCPFSSVLHYLTPPLVSNNVAKVEGVHGVLN